MKLRCALCCLALVVAATALAAPAWAKIYRYVDKDGSEHFVDGIEKVPAPYRDQIEDISEHIEQKVDEGTVRTIRPAAPESGNRAGSTGDAAGEDAVDASAAATQDALDYSKLSWLAAPLAQALSGAFVLHDAAPLRQEEIDELAARERRWLLPVSGSWFWACLLALGLAVHAFRAKHYAWVPVVLAGPALGIALLWRGAATGQTQWLSYGYSALLVLFLYTTLYVGRTAPWRKAAVLAALFVPWAVAAVAGYDYYRWFKAAALARGAVF